jgi:hypothetical protein
MRWSTALPMNFTVAFISVMRRLAFDKSMGRAEAMRQSMLDLTDHGTPSGAHPAYQN